MLLLVTQSLHAAIIHSLTMLPPGPTPDKVVLSSCGKCRLLSCREPRFPRLAQENRSEISVRLSCAGGQDGRPARQRTSGLCGFACGVRRDYLVSSPTVRLAAVWGRCPVLIVTAGAFLFIAVTPPVAFPKPFQWYLGHSINEMVSVDAHTNESWALLWGRAVWDSVRLFDLGQRHWAVLNAIWRDSPLSNMLTLLLGVGWFFLNVWASVARFPF